jgi:ABC-type phosphate transport system permease subunit
MYQTTSYVLLLKIHEAKNLVPLSRMNACTVNFTYDITLSRSFKRTILILYIVYLLVINSLPFSISRKVNYFFSSTVWSNCTSEVGTQFPHSYYRK